MKHLKKYLDIDYPIEWKVGDYVLVDITNFNNDAKMELGIPIYINILPAMIVSLINDREFPFKVELTNGNRLEAATHEIMRYLNKEEISMYKVESDSYKFGL